MDEQKLYIMKNSFGLIKIGISKDPETRANTLRLASGVAIDVLEIYECKNAYKLEQYLHNIFEESRLEGEWFKDVSPEDVVCEGMKYTKMREWCGGLGKTQKKEHTLTQTSLPEGYLNVTDASKMLGISRKTMYQHINSGKLKKEYCYGKPCVSISELERIYGHQKVIKTNKDTNTNTHTNLGQKDDEVFNLRRENALLKDRIKIIQDLLGSINIDDVL